MPGSAVGMSVDPDAAMGDYGAIAAGAIPAPAVI
jgi:hypothetical protein